MPDAAPTPDNSSPDHVVTELEARTLGSTAGLALQQPAFEALPTDNVPTVEATESAQQVERRFEQFMRELSVANYAAYEAACNDFSFKGRNVNRTDAMKVVMEGYGGFLIESTLQPDEAASLDVPLSAE